MHKRHYASGQRHALTLTGLAILGTLTVTPGAAISDEAELSLARALALAIARNPVVVQSTLEQRRLEGAALGVAGILADNPVLSAQAGIRRDIGWVGNQPSVIGSLEQPLDLLGQAGTRRRAADDLVAAARARVALAKVEVGARVRLAYLTAQIATARVALAHERIANARASVDALKLRTGLGASSDIELHLANAEAARAEATLRQADLEVERSVTELRTLLDLAPDTSARPSDTLGPPLLELAPLPPDLLARHVAVQAVEKRRLAIDSEILRLERERLPRVALGIAFELPSEQERFIGGALSISPALWRRNQGPIAEARVERERAQFERDTTVAALQRRWNALREEHALLVGELGAVESALHDEEEVRTLVRAGWQAGKFDFLRVLLAERSVAESKQSRLSLWAELWNTAIETRRLRGEEP